ncbi:MAG TPA: insulinase family protein, partial [Acidobacteriota bacterium]|nr:insulinase family protein [Acidobacteriota bacterium]
MVWASLLLVFVSLFVPQTGGRRSAPQREAAAPPEYLKAIASRDDQSNKARIVLRSGLVVLIEEQAADPLLVVQSTIQAGTADETQEERGAARVLAQLLLHSGFGQGVQKLSGTARVEVNEHATTFSSIVPAQNLDKILPLHAGLFTFPEIKQERLIFFKQLIGEELARQPGPLESARYAREPSSEQALAPELDLSKIQAFQKRHYRYSNTLLCLVGGVIREQLLGKVVELYGKGRSSPEEKKLPADFVPGAFSYTFSQAKVSQPYVFLKYRGPGRNHSDFYPFLLLSYVLGQGESAILRRLESTVLSEVRLAASLSDGSLLITLVPAEGDIDRAEITALAQIEVLRSKGVNEDQLASAKALLLSDYYSGLAGLEARARALTTHELLGNGLDRDQVPGRIASINGQDLKRAAERYLDTGNLAVHELVPENAEVRTFTSESFQGMLQTLLPPAVAKAGEAKELAIRESPSIASAVSYKPRYLKYELKKTSVVRGPDIYYQENHSAPLVYVGFFYPGGRFDEAEGKRGITEVLLRSVMRTALRTKGAAAAGDLDQIGAKVEVVNEPDYFGFQGKVLSNHLDTFLRTVIGWVRQTKIEESDMNQARMETLARLRLERDEARVSPSVLVWKDHPYGRSRYGSEDELQTLDLAAVEQWRQSHLGRMHPLILLQGDVDGTSFLEGLVSVLSDRRLEAAEASLEEEEEEEEGEEEESGPLRTVDEPTVPGLIVFAGPEKNSFEERVLQLIESVLEGPGGLIADSVWDTLGIALPGEFSHQTRLRGGTIAIRYRTLGMREEEARRQVLKVVMDLKGQPLPRDRFLAGISRSISQFYEENQEPECFLPRLAMHV